MEDFNGSKDEQRQMRNNETCKTENFNGQNTKILLK